MTRPTDFGILLDLVDYLTGKPRSFEELITKVSCDKRTGHRYLERLDDLGFELERKRVGHKIKSYQITRVPTAFKTKITSIHDKITLH